MALTQTNLTLGERIDSPGGNTASFTTASFTPANNSLLVVVVNGSALTSWPASSNFTVSGGGLTWTQRVTGEDQETRTEIWTAPVVTGASMAVTVDHPTATVFQWSVQVLGYTGHNSVSPLGASVSALPLNDGAVTINLSAAPLSSSHVIAARSLSGASATLETAAATPGADWTEICDTNHNTASWGAGGLQVQYRATSTSTSVDWADINTNNSTDVGTVAMAIEIRDASAPTIKTVIITAGTTWAVPADFTNNNTVTAIGAGGAGRSANGGAGGGGGACSSSDNLSAAPGSSVNIQIGQGGTPGVNGTDTWWNTSGTLMAKGGTSATGTTTGNGTGGLAASGVGTRKSSGGDGAIGGSALGGGGGGGAGGPTNGAAGIGGAGARGDNTAAGDDGGGGGGSGAIAAAAGTIGQVGSTAGGDGGASAGQTLGTGGSGAVGGNGTNGGGGGGGDQSFSGGNGGPGLPLWTETVGGATAGPGGGAGGAGNLGAAGGTGGLYGGAGGGGTTGGNGRNGAIIVTYQAASGLPPIFHRPLRVWKKRF